LFTKNLEQTKNKEQRQTIMSKNNFILHTVTKNFFESSESKVVLLGCKSIESLVLRLIDWNTFHHPVAYSETCTKNYSNDSPIHVTLEYNGEKTKVKFDSLYIVCVQVSVNRESVNTTSIFGNDFPLYQFYQTIIEIANEKFWKSIVTPQQSHDVFEMFREMHDLLTVEEIEERNVRVTFSELFPEDCFQNIMFYLDVSDWLSFSLSNKDCQHFADRIIWKQLYYQMTGIREKSEQSTYLELCSSINNRKRNWSNPVLKLNTISIDSLDAPSNERNEQFWTLLQQRVFTLVLDEDDDDGMGFSLF
jgi:hypothetical protein